MKPRQVAIACQGGGIHGAFTCGVLDAILKVKEDQQAGGLPAGARRSFDIVGLSGTSAGALNAFMVWYGLMAKGGRPGSFAEARQSLNHLWDTFQVNTVGETGINWLAQCFYALAEQGVVIKQPNPAEFSDQLTFALRNWSALTQLLAPGMDAGEIRPEFYDFMALLASCAPEFPRLQENLQEIAADRIKPRLLLGAVEVLTGTFTAFDSWFTPDLKQEATSGERRPISYEAVAASGTLPDLRPSQRIPGLTNSDGKESLYWDGVFSQNPPVRQFCAATEGHHTPDEIWVIRINPQARDDNPETLGPIEDRRNELAGNLSLNQELYFISKVNKWQPAFAAIAKQNPHDPVLSRLADYKPIRIYMITMDKTKASLGVGSKFNRSPDFVSELREHGRVRAGRFLPLWLSASEELVEWPHGDALG